MKYFFFVAAAFFFAVSFANAAPSITPVNLTIEYLTNPKGLDEKIPRFSWTFKTSDEKAIGQKQTSYRILVSTSEDNLKKILVTRGIQNGSRLIKCN